MGVILSERCKLCGLIDLDANLWRETHRRVFDEEQPYAQIVRWLNGRLEIKNELLPEDRKITLFTKANFYHHFNKKHVSNLEEVDSAINVGFAIQDPSSRRIQIHRAAYRNIVERQALSEEVDDFKRMKALIAAAEQRLHGFNRQMTTKEVEAVEAGGEAKVDLNEITTFQKLIADLLKLKKEAAAIESSSKVAGTALQEAVEMIVESTVTRIESVAEEIQRLLVRELPGSRLPDQVAQIIRSRVGDTMKQAIPEVLNAISVRYGIK